MRDKPAAQFSLLKTLPCTDYTKGNLFLIINAKLRAKRLHLTYTNLVYHRAGNRWSLMLLIYQTSKDLTGQNETLTI